MNTFKKKNLAITKKNYSSFLSTLLYIKKSPPSLEPDGDLFIW